MKTILDNINKKIEIKQMIIDSRTKSIKDLEKEVGELLKMKENVTMFVLSTSCT